MGGSGCIKGSRLLPLTSIMHLSLLVLSVIVGVSGGDDFKAYWKTMTKLQTDVFKDYDSTINPYSTKFSNYTWNSDGMTTSITLIRSKLLSVQEPEQSFSAATSVLLEWVDPRLTWDITHYNGIDHLYVRRSRVWMPEIVPTGVAAIALFETINVKIFPNGHLMMTPYFYATHNCEIKSDNFPFDINHCMICFILIGGYNEEMRLRGRVLPVTDLFSTGEFTYSLFKPRPTFALDSTDENMPFSSVLFHFVIERQPQFWVCLIILPTFSISTLVLVGIFFGDEAQTLNEVVDLGLTGMMSLTVIVGILNDSIAKSETLSALGRFVFYDIIIVVVAIVVVLFAQKLRRKLRNLSDEKLKCQKTSVFWLTVKKYGASKKIAHYLLFLIFFTLHLFNLVLMLIRPEDAGANLRSMTTFNTTMS